MGNTKQKSVKWASATLISMLVVLLAITVFSGGLAGLPGIWQSLAYFAIVSAPIAVTILLANRKARI